MFGPHVFAPTGVNLFYRGATGTILAGFHDDISFMTAHGMSNFPGLHIWTRDGRRIPVLVPDGCLLMQAGQQFQHVTGGRVLSGHHEVVVTEDMRPRIKDELAQGKIPWRVSTTLFVHVRPEETLQPLGKFATEEALAAYQPVEAGQQVRDEPARIDLATQGATV
jgi:isopenicillin N synthase-like dioxygenase